MLKRPKHPAGTMVMGAVILVIGLVFLPNALQNPTEQGDRLGLPAWLIAGGLFLFSLYFIALGLMWAIRDKRGS